MKKLIISLITVAVLASCSSTSVNDVDAKRSQLQKYKQQQHELSQKIAQLEEELAGSEEIEIINVRISDINTQKFEHFIEVTGKVEAENDVDVSPESAGIIEEIYVREGQKVSKGDVLATLRTDALQRTMDQLQIQYDLAATNYKRQKNLWDQNIGSEMQYLQAKTNMESLEKQIEAMKAQMEMSEIKSPVTGYVDNIYQKTGESGSPQIPFAKVINIDKIKIYADVSESYLTKVKSGDSVNVFFPAINYEITTTIQQIGNVIDPNNRTFRVRLNLNNSGNLIKPNLVSIVKIRNYKSENAIVVPTLLVKEDFRGQYTYVALNENGKDVARKLYVKSGITNNNMTEITEGLTAGMQIISDGYNQVSDGTTIRF
jgi:membrane fusion protein, multidrug efflux system